jgi:putative transposase
VLEGRRYRLALSPEQQELAVSFAAAARCVFNIAKEQRDRARKLCRLMPSYAMQCRDLTELRAENDWISAAPVHVLQQALRDCDNAYQRFVRGQAGYPRWRKKGNDDSFRFPDPAQIQLRKLSRKWWEVRLPKLGWCRFRWTRSIGGQVRNVTVSVDRTGCWWVSFCVDTSRHPAVPNSGPAVGVDRGVIRAYQTSEGEDDHFEVPGLRPKEAERLRWLQRQAARKQKGSKRRRRTQTDIARLRRRERNRRQDAIHRLSRRLAGQYGMVVIEALDVRALSASAQGTIGNPGCNVAQKRRLNREIRARGWGELRRQLGYKAVFYGSQVVEVPARNTSVQCSHCGHTAQENRESQAVFRCRACGWGPVNADYNAAINIRERGIKLALAPGPGVAARGALGIGRAGRREPRSGPRTTEAA